MASLLSLNSGGEEAYTLIQRAVLSNSIIDGRLVAATPRALRLYGLTEKDLPDTWQSLSQPIDAYRRSRELGIARHFAQDIPTRYIIRIRRPNGETVPVIKEPRELIINGVSYWLTRVIPASEDPDTPDADRIQVPIQASNYQEFGGRYCLAEIEEMVAAADQTSRLASLSSSLTHVQIKPIIDAMDAIGLDIRHNLDVTQILLQNVLDRIDDPETEMPDALDDAPTLIFGRPVNRLPNGQVLYECQRCGRIWLNRGSEQLPTRCPQPGKRCYDWQGLKRSRDSKR
jgi:PAS domain-containing protein